MAWLLLRLDSACGHRPLHIGERAVVTAQLKRPIANAKQFYLEETGGFSVETAPIRVFRDNQVVWRVRATGDSHAELSLLINGQTSPDVAWLRVDYPKSGPAWMVWFFAASTLTALLSARFLR
jgi:hypothetical protein